MNADRCRRGARTRRYLLVAALTLGAPRLAVAQCFSVFSFKVQVLGAPMCLHDKAGTKVFEAGRRYHADRLKALGIMLSTIKGRTRLEADATDYRQRVHELTALVHRGFGERIRVPVTPVRDVLLPSRASRTSYRLSTATMAAVSLALSPDAAATSGGVGQDPIGAALALRAIAYANALDQQSVAAVRDAAPPRQAIMRSGDAFAGEAARFEAEGHAVRTYLAGAQAQVDGAALQLLAYQAMQGEAQRLRRTLRAQPFLKAP